MDEATPRRPYRTLREFAEDERPRERLLRHGPDVLGDSELVALVLGSGMRGENVLDVARALLDSVGGLANLVRTDARALQRARGLGPAKAAQLAAAIELGRRAQQLDPDSRPLLNFPEGVFAFLGSRLAARTREELVVLALDTRGRLLGSATTLTGTADTLHMRIGEAFKTAVLHDASAVIFVHNHPSGDPRPSPQDVRTTQLLIGAGKLLDIEVLDHVIVGQGRFCSLRREGYWGTKAEL